jgi:hypothetical protein
VFTRFSGFARISAKRGSRIRLFCALAFATLLSCVGAARSTGNTAEPPSLYQELDASYSALRQQFNRDAGHVRILMLLSPT